jgi:hypothetical protein
MLGRSWQANRIKQMPIPKTQKKNRTCPRTIMFYGWKLLQGMLLFLVILVGLAVAKVMDEELYLYHIPDASGVIIDYEANPDVESPDFIYGEDQGARVVEFYAP